MPGEPRSPIAPHASTPAELQQRLAIERRGVPFLVYRDPDGHQLVRTIAPDERAVAIGRGAGASLRIEFDDEVSRLHTALERVGEEWTIVDDGLSRNGTYVGNERIHGRRRLADNEIITVGRTALLFRCPDGGAVTTRSAQGVPLVAGISAADRCVLVALCRPLRDAPAALPASNQQIADELHLSVPAVKKRLGALFERFGFGELPQNEKRSALAQAVIRTGVVAPGEL
ncbi:MAG: FHA domain-containing protein [Solirubrobacteraceae bacterium]